MKKILILTCGGTLTMKRDKKGVLVPFYSGKRLLEKVSILEKIAQIKVKNIVNIDSTNMQPKIWSTLALAIKQDYLRYDGFVITHGTDTMAYTASALSFILGNLDKPIVFTGAQKTLDELGSDGINNLINATIVATMDMAEVCIVFGSKILRGNRATKMSESSLDPFESPMVAPLGEIALEPKLQESYKKRNYKRDLDFKPNFDENVVVVRLHPGAEERYIEQILLSGCRGVVIQAFGPGNIPDKFLPFFAKAQKDKVPIVVLSQCYRGITRMQLYEVGHKALEAGAIPGGDMTVESAVTKLMWILGKTRDISKVRKLFKENIAGEVTN